MEFGPYSSGISRRSSPRLDCQIARSFPMASLEVWYVELLREIGTYETADGDPIRVGFAAGCTLHFEGVVEGCLLRVFWLEVCDPNLIQRAIRQLDERVHATYPSRSAFSASANILLVIVRSYCREVKSSQIGKKRKTLVGLVGLWVTLWDWTSSLRSTFARHFTFDRIRTARNV